MNIESIARDLSRILETCDFQVPSLELACLQDSFEPGFLDTGENIRVSEVCSSEDSPSSYGILAVGLQGEIQMLLESSDPVIIKILGRALGKVTGIEISKDTIPGDQENQTEERPSNPGANKGKTTGPGM